MAGSILQEHMSGADAREFECYGSLRLSEDGKATFSDLHGKPVDMTRYRLEERVKILLLQYRNHVLVTYSGSALRKLLPVKPQSQEADAFMAPFVEWYQRVARLECYYLFDVQGYLIGLFEDVCSRPFVIEVRRRYARLLTAATLNNLQQGRIIPLYANAERGPRGHFPGEIPVWEMCSDYRAIPPRKRERRTRRRRIPNEHLFGACIVMVSNFWLYVEDLPEFGYPGQLPLFIPLSMIRRVTPYLNGVEIAFTGNGGCSLWPENHNLWLTTGQGETLAQILALAPGMALPVPRSLKAFSRGGHRSRTN